MNEKEIYSNYIELKKKIEQVDIQIKTLENKIIEGDIVCHAKCKQADEDKLKCENKSEKLGCFTGIVTLIISCLIINPLGEAIQSVTGELSGGVLLIIFIIVSIVIYFIVMEIFLGRVMNKEIKSMNDYKLNLNTNSQCKKDLENRIKERDELVEKYKQLIVSI